MLQRQGRTGFFDLAQAHMEEEASLFSMTMVMIEGEVVEEPTFYK
jgi:hypothetical protein